MKKLILLTLCMILAASNVFAAKTPTVVRLGDYETLHMNLCPTDRGECIIGCQMPPAFAIPDWIYGEEGYKLLVCPWMCCGTVCPIGFLVEDVHMLMQFAAADVPAVFDVFVDLEDAEGDPSCWYPGIVDCISGAYTVTITDPGLYDIGIPMEPDNCNCAYMLDPVTLEPYYYFISFHFITAFDPLMRPDAITQDMPTACASYNDYGFGWEDLVVVYGFPGNVILYANVFCCEDPVTSEPTTWGGVKSLYH